jgi:hypothetical protein
MGNLLLNFLRKEKKRKKIFSLGQILFDVLVTELTSAFVAALAFALIG